ncbi:hypothetical protein MAR_038415 [Mya arenaria]|uniref:Uncharacterized protein n=1 Tax=Mya arenaria TaxID=6604 RepID=A0ABY7G064_MYAAR|nr:hypothetical protein MAR_038415 [Mya arenaria]
MAKMFFREIMQDSKQKPSNPDLKKFKTSTGSPILYTRFRKHRGIYYPLAKHYQGSKTKPKQNHKHACVIYSKTYGREMYGNIDIWPEDEHAKEKLLQKLQALSMEEEEEENDVGIDIPRALDEMNENKVLEHKYGTEHGTRTKSPNGTRHVTIVVTDASEEEGEEDEEEERTYPTSGEHSPIPDPDRPDTPAGEEGSWPLKRSQRCIV